MAAALVRKPRVMVELGVDALVRADESFELSSSSGSMPHCCPGVGQCWPSCGQ